MVDQFRQNKDGTISFPARGRPPKAVDGYLPTADPWTWKPDLPHCAYRQYKDDYAPCCGFRVRTVCAYIGLPINYRSCQKCRQDPTFKDRMRPC